MFAEALQKTASRWDRTRVYADIGEHLKHMDRITKEKRIVGGVAGGAAAAIGGAAYYRHHKKTADAPSSPMIDPRKAKQMQAGAMSGGTSMGQAWSNLKSGLGFGAAAPQDAGTLSR